MEVREATEGDLPEIIKLLKLSLGESLLPKSEAFWNWKHNQNPFGKSPVLLAIEKNQVVGVRAFMRWSWKLGEKKIEAARAVDTATHPDFMGKGIFKKLTLSLLKECEEKGYSFIYNTPNKKSMPGYLKMNWQVAGRFPIRMQLLKPFSMARNLAQLKPEKEIVMELPDSLEYCFNHPALTQLILTQSARFNNCMVTNYTLEYLKWRYAAIPTVKYNALVLEKNGHDLNGVIFYRLKTTKLGIEMRVTDCFLSNNGLSKEDRASLKKRAELHGATYITASNYIGTDLFTKYVGPFVTVRSLGDYSLQNQLHFANWSPTTGDMELF